MYQCTQNSIIVENEHKPSDAIMKKNESSRGCGTSRLAFTLIELLVVIAIISLLAATMLPVIGMIRAQVKTLKCTKNQQQAVMACMLYANDNESGLPATWMAGSYWPFLIKTYLDALVKTNFNNSVTDTTAVCPEWKPAVTIYSIGPSAYLYFNGQFTSHSTSCNFWPTNGEVWTEFKVSSIDSPSQRLYFADINWPGISNRAIFPTVGGGSTNSIAFRHRSRTTAIFIDGHGSTLNQTEALQALKGKF
jgi:prepilin-type N-terminal cleavage/methylation domain-containing protein